MEVPQITRQIKTLDRHITTVLFASLQKYANMILNLVCTDANRGGFCIDVVQAADNACCKKLYTLIYEPDILIISDSPTWR
jgi:hypothetical protein